MTTAEGKFTADQITEMKEKIKSATGDSTPPAFEILCPQTPRLVDEFSVRTATQASIFFETFLFRDNKPGQIFDLFGALLTAASTFAGVDSIPLVSKISDTQTRLQSWKQFAEAITDEFDVAQAKTGQPIVLFRGDDRRLSAITFSYQNTEVLRLRFDWRTSILHKNIRSVQTSLEFFQALSNDGFKVNDILTNVTLTAADLSGNNATSVESACSTFERR
ncbi:MAG: hypothetical protein HPM95_16860 [Alphaproteobacteria bacterium]|nr:hypothetical protein [Alphaproteobacteria bacterium]